MFINDIIAPKPTVTKLTNLFMLHERLSFLSLIHVKFQVYKKVIDILLIYLCQRLALEVP